jgi:hypothetical protein
MTPSDRIVQSYCKYFHGRGQEKANLKEGTEGTAVMNISRALHALEMPVRWTDTLDSHLRKAVQLFQEQVKHPNTDGIVGPGTRKKLVNAILTSPTQGANFFSELEATWDDGFFAVFLSYAWADNTLADDIHACLQYNGVTVLRDISDFFASGELKDEIRRNIESADKVLTVVTDTSLNRDWVQYEQQIAAMVSDWKVQPFTLYLKLTAKEMPKYLTSRIYIDGRGKTVERIGFDLRCAICHRKPKGPDLPYNPDKILVP